MAQKLTSGRRLTRRDLHTRSLWKTTYRTRYGTAPLYILITGKPVAIDSDDHKWPRGTLYDNSTNRGFNVKLYDYFGNRSDLRVLDVGCSGGGFVKTVLEDGFTGIGIEGSDISRTLCSGEWSTCPHHLFTGDITEPFTLQTVNGSPVKFHCITAWELLEHIPADKLGTLMDNINKHLEPDGLFIASIATFPDANPLTGAVYHVTREPREWWLSRFAERGLAPVDPHPFVTADYVRGHGHGLTDWDPKDGDGFHIVMQKAKSD